ncbi:helix-hairpin-helix domain-containing protein [Natrinema salinisoli]|uniref:helix-hairpin-helix domain-containing protein n=1 Tax=Natrinema salinisoli TaxID=2878535 RepID=UPI001CF0B238|nr:helix-hairpin-helix domain-containing protein [Natrinema salinisoli]
MSGRFSNADVGKTVENENGEVIGRITETRGDTVSVEPNPGVIASIKAALGWKRAHDETLVIHEDAIETASDEMVRLESDPDVAAMQAAVDERDSSPETYDLGFDAKRSRDGSAGAEGDGIANRTTERESGGDDPGASPDETEPLTAADADEETVSADELETSEKQHPAAEVDEGGTEADPTHVDIDDDQPEPESREDAQAASITDETVGSGVQDPPEESSAVDGTSTNADLEMGDDGSLEMGPRPEETAGELTESMDDNQTPERSTPDEATSTEDTGDKRDTTEVGSSTSSDESIGRIDSTSLEDVSDGLDDADELSSTADVSTSLEDVSEGLDDADERSPSEDVNLTDELHPGTDIEALEGADESDPVTVDAGTADQPSDEPEEVDSNVDPESATTIDRTLGPDIDPDTIEGQHTDVGNGVETADRRIVTDDRDIDRRSTETGGEHERTTVGDRETESDGATTEETASDEPTTTDGRHRSTPASALFAGQRAALESGNRTVQNGVEAQRRIAVAALSGGLALQRQRLTLVERAASAPFELVTAISGSSRGETDVRLEDRRDELEQGREQLGPDADPTSHPLEHVGGLDTMYRKRLADAGITSLDDLARADSDTVAEAAGVTEKRAKSWIEQVET